MQRRSWGQDIQPALENGLLERGGRRCGWEPFRKLFRGLLIHKGRGDSRSRNSLWPPPCRHLHGERVPGILSWIRGKDAARGDTVLSSILPEPVPPSVLWCSVVYRSTLINSFCLGEIHQAFTLCMTHLPVAGGAQLPRIA